MKPYKTLRRKIAAKFKMHFIGSLIKLIRICEVLLHGRLFENFIKSMKIRLVRRCVAHKFNLLLNAEV